MPLVKNRAVVDDPWVRIDDGGDLPLGAAAIVTLERWTRDGDALARRHGKLGILLHSDQSPAAVAEHLARFDLVALEFPRFTDGRAYSYARLLRERYRFAGELRAVGNVLRDQLFFMHRCGFDAFEVAEGTDVGRWLTALDEISVAYQPTADGSPVGWRGWRRRASRESYVVTAPAATAGSGKAEAPIGCAGGDAKPAANRAS